MTQQQIDTLIKVRNEITRLMEWQGLRNAVDLIDALLCEVPAGARNDVDLLLGRMCARLPEQTK